MSKVKDEYYTDSPDNWIVFHIKGNESYPNDYYKILAGWSGGYLYGDSWKINSGIKSVKFKDPYYYFRGFSGSVYRCHKDSYTLRLNNDYIWNQLIEKYPNRIKMIDEDTDFLKLKYY